ncbi:MAG TPA: hypothetical protein DEB06_03715 [Phycisphaerales bacterium]|nr:hypothetical protein [Phycisphaerales bacterium]
MGRFTVVHLVTGASAEPYRKAVEARSAELAAVQHRFVSDGAEFASLTGAAGAPADDLAGVALLDSAGAPLKTGAIPAAGAGAFDALVAFVSGATRTRAIADYNLPKNSNLAIDGYDPVAYFVAKPVRGTKDLSSTYRGVRYQFSSPDNRNLFNQSPESYLPTYGGWCAAAIGAKDEKVEIDPRNFKIKDGRLHLFYKDLFSDALKDWNKHEREWEPAADRNWEKRTGEKPRAATPGGQ